MTEETIRGELRASTKNWSNGAAVLLGRSQYYPTTVEAFADTRRGRTKQKCRNLTEAAAAEAFQFSCSCCCWLAPIYVQLLYINLQENVDM